MFHLDNGNCFLSKEFLAYGLAGVISEPYRQPYPPKKLREHQAVNNLPNPSAGRAGPHSPTPRVHRKNHS